jgi:hypothetical protein
MAEVTYNVGKARILAGLLSAGTTNLAMAIIITSKAGASDPDLTTMAAIDAVGTVALHSNRQNLASVTVGTDNTNDRINVDAADVAFPAAAGVTALAAVIYDKTTDTSDATRIPVIYFDTGFGSGLPMDGGLNVSIADFLRAS